MKKKFNLSLKPTIAHLIEFKVHSQFLDCELVNCGG